MQQYAVQSLFPPNRAAWWHWSSEVWLLAFHDPNVTVVSLRSEVKQASPGVHCLVIKVEGLQWAGFGPPTWQEWFNAHWK
jgi:hypothetical protein